MSISAPNRLVESLQERIAEVESGFHLAYWESQVDANPDSEKRRAELELELRRIKGDRNAFGSVAQALEGEVHDPLLLRQLEVLRLSLTGNQMTEEDRERIVQLSSAIESDFAAYRPEIDGRRLSDNELEEILRESGDAALRKRAWSASKEVGALVADRVLDLARVRNKVARDLGFADYYRMSLALQEIPEGWLFEVLDELADATEEPYRKWKRSLDERLRDRFGTEDLYPWHYADPFFQSLPPDGAVGLDGLLMDAAAPDLAQDTFKSWDLDITGVLAKSDLYPRERKSQHAFCIDIDRSGDDVRILANVVPGERWIEVMLHESGHAAYDIAIDHSLPYLLHRAAHTFVTESIAILCGRLVRDPEWLVQVVGVPAEEVVAIEGDLRRSSVAQSLLFARWGLVMVHFERELYSDPEGDLNARWWELVERYQLVSAPSGRDAPDWAAKVHLAGAPVYYHNYLLGEMLASQLAETARSECGGLAGNPEVGRLLSDRIFRHGAMMRWDALVEEATGRSLSARDLAKDFRSL